MNCNICDKVFTGIESFKQHEASAKHRKKVDMHRILNPDSTTNPHNATEMPKMQNAQSVSCDTSSGIFDSKLEYTTNVHTRMIVKEITTTENVHVISCGPCSKTFNNILEYQAHSVSEEHARMILKEKLELSPKSDELLCSVVDSTTSLEKPNSELNMKPILPVNFSRCELCSKSFTGKEPYLQHIASSAHKKKEQLAGASNPLLGTAVCNTTDVADQISELNVNPDFPANFSRCDLCNKSFSGPEPYMQHIASVAHKKKEVLAAAPPDSILSNKILECLICDKRFSGPEPYQQHLDSKNHKKKLSANGVSYSCSMCDEHFTDAESYHQHNNTDNHKNKAAAVSNLTRAYYCEDCDKQCTGIVPYEQHMKGEMHMKKMFTKYGFQQSKENEGEKANPSPNNYCEFCKKQCTDAASYKDHLSSVCHARKFVDISAENKRKEIQNLLSPLRCKGEEMPQQKSDANGSVSKFLYKEYAEECFAINPVNFNVTIFKVGEDIDFDKKTNNIQALNVATDEDDNEEIMCDDCPSPSDDQNDEEIMYDDCPSP